MCFYSDIVGSHVGKKVSFLETAKYAKCNNFNSFQIFTGNTKGYYRKTPCLKDLEATNKFIQDNTMKMFIHSIYLINLGRADGIEKSLDNLKWELEWGPRMGASGVVVHVGKYLKGSEDTAVQNMKDNIAKLVDGIDTSCPLLIETPAGQGTECLTKMEDFGKFVSEMKELYPGKIDCCLDSCHIYASGYQPLDYMKSLESQFGLIPRLFHYNDSKTPLGSRKDRHELPGEGHIGSQPMEELMNYCVTKDVPMVLE